MQYVTNFIVKMVINDINDNNRVGFMSNVTEKIEEVEQTLANYLGDWMDRFGGKPTIGRMLGILLTQTELISLTELAAKCHVSKPAMSNNAAAALSMDLIAKVFVKESPREDFYHFGGDYMATLVKGGATKVTIQHEYFKKTLEKFDLTEETLKKAKPEEIAKYKQLKRTMELHVKTFEVLKDEMESFYENLSKKVEAIYKEAHN